MEVRIAHNGIFQTLQGEGIFSGTPATFIRLQGCHRRCTWCDEPGALERGLGFGMDPEALAQLIDTAPYRDVVFTGGEPLLQGDALEEVINLTAKRKMYHIETSGEIDHRALFDMDVITVSPKLSSSGAAFTPRKVSTLNNILRDTEEPQEVQFKFVVSSVEDLDEVKSILGEMAFYERGTPVIIQAEESARERIEPAIVTAMLAPDTFKGLHGPFRFQYMRRLHKDLNLR